ncbi:hypothetical protein IMG5_148520 [Ichthyophthirius multifiliis]|uniref:Transmembrane protein n=1 Tax=Ichthyophthirius multifiliis TaxID=5932 RepID=G0QYA8_ICHMU|nr:hypothetical protein IMG5_148520 [Ichthyophthirius multifiliis]EGR29771.1 hypothetical protein IMG5_148520 [Ichthyophthirius multifiliis]|eukprot:XP_004031007.1 hypothetical protein IMG5_148520 [Ichthyophthirius multifiliis]
MLKQMKVWLIIYNGEEIKDVILFLKLVNLILIILSLAEQNILLNNALQEMMAMGKLLKIVLWIIAKKLIIQFFAKIIHKKLNMISIHWNIMALIQDAQYLLLIMDKVIYTIEIFDVITLNVLLILLTLLQIFLTQNFKIQYADNKTKEIKCKSLKENQNLVTLLVLIIQENFVVILLNVLIIVLERVFVQMDNVNAYQDGLDLIVILNKDSVNNLFQKKISKNAFNNVPKVNLQILTKYVENSVLMVITKIIQIKYVLNAIYRVQNVLVLQRMIVQNAVFLHIQKKENV